MSGSEDADDFLPRDQATFSCASEHEDPAVPLTEMMATEVLGDVTPSGREGKDRDSLGVDQGAGQMIEGTEGASAGRTVCEAEHQGGEGHDHNHSHLDQVKHISSIG